MRGAARLRGPLAPSSPDAAVEATTKARMPTVSKVASIPHFAIARV